MFFVFQFSGKKIEQFIREGKGFMGQYFRDLSSCTPYIVEVNLILENESQILYIDSNPIPPLNKSFVTLPYFNKEVKIFEVENGTDYISFEIKGILSIFFY